jgi:hypothetical protein
MSCSHSLLGISCSNTLKTDSPLQFQSYRARRLVVSYAGAGAGASGYKAGRFQSASVVKLLPCSSNPHTYHYQPRGHMAATWSLCQCSTRGKAISDRDDVTILRSFLAFKSPGGVDDSQSPALPTLRIVQSRVPKWKQIWRSFVMFSVTWSSRDRSDICRVKEQNSVLQELQRCVALGARLQRSSLDGRILLYWQWCCWQRRQCRLWQDPRSRFVESNRGGRGRGLR